MVFHYEPDRQGCRPAARKFYELHEAGSPVAAEALERISALYGIESRIRGAAAGAPAAGAGEA